MKMLIRVNLFLMLGLVLSACGVALTEVLPGTPNRIEADVIHKNGLAVAIMTAEGIPVLDLHMVSLGLMSEHVNSHDVHFTAVGSAALGAAILNELNVLYGIN